MGFRRSPVTGPECIRTGCAKGLRLCLCRGRLQAALDCGGPRRFACHRLASLCALASRRGAACCARGVPRTPFVLRIFWTAPSGASQIDAKRGLPSPRQMGPPRSTVSRAWGIVAALPFRLRPYVVIPSESAVANDEGSAVPTCFYSVILSVAKDLRLASVGAGFSPALALQVGISAFGCSLLLDHSTVGP